MYGREKRVLLREYLEQGWSKSALAEKLGISRRTIYHWIETGQTGARRGRRGGPLQGRARSLSPQDRSLPPDHRRTVAGLSAVECRAAARGDRAAGYSGGYTQVKEYVRRRFARSSMTRWCASRRRRDIRRRWTSRTSACRGAGDGPCWWYWATHGCLWLRFFRRQDMENALRGAGAGIRLLRGRTPRAALRPDEGR